MQQDALHPIPIRLTSSRHGFAEDSLTNKILYISQLGQLRKYLGTKSAEMTPQAFIRGCLFSHQTQAKQSPSAEPTPARTACSRSVA